MIWYKMHVYAQAHLYFYFFSIYPWPILEIFINLLTLTYMHINKMATSEILYPFQSQSVEHNLHPHTFPSHSSCYAICICFIIIHIHIHFNLVNGHEANWHHNSHFPHIFHLQVKYITNIISPYIYSYNCIS